MKTTHKMTRLAVFAMAALFFGKVSLGGTIAINEGFETTAVGAMPSSWTRTGSTAGVTDQIACTGSKSLKITDIIIIQRPTILT